MITATEKLIQNPVTITWDPRDLTSRKLWTRDGNLGHYALPLKEIEPNKTKIISSNYL